MSSTLRFLEARQADRAGLEAAREWAKAREQELSSAHIPNSQWGQIRGLAARSEPARLVDALKDLVKPAGYSGRHWDRGSPSLGERLVGQLEEVGVAQRSLHLALLAARMQRPAAPAEARGGDS